MENINIDVSSEDNLERLDSYISKQISNISRSRIQGLIKEGLVLVNGKLEKSSYIVQGGDRINVQIPEDREPEILPEDLNIDIVYEDEDLCIINKSPDMVVHPGTGNYSGTLVNALLFHMDSLSDINGEVRPGIVHRLDKDTAGLLVIAKNNETHELLAKKFKERDIERKYMALVHGSVSQDRGTIDAPIGRHPVHRKKMTVIKTNSKEAVTHYRVVDRFHQYTLMELQLETGRTHQIRVHMAHINHPIVGDPLYSRGKNEFKLDRQALYAQRLAFYHPENGQYMEFESELPEYFKKIIKNLKARRK